MYRRPKQHPALTSGVRVLLKNSEERIFCCGENGQVRFWREDETGYPTPDDRAKESDIVAVLDSPTE